MNATPFTPSFVGATGQYPIFDYVDSSSNSNYLYSSNSSNINYGYSSNLKTEIESLKQKDISHDSSISSINSTIGTIQGEVAANTTAIAGQATQITTLEATTAANTTAIGANTGAIVDLNLNKVNKSSFNSTGLIYMDVAGNVQLSYDNTAFSQYVVITGNASVMTLNDTYKNLPTSISSINTNLNNNYFNKDQLSNVFITSNIHSNTSNTLANYNNLYNKPLIFTQLETSNIFITSNIHSNTSNTLANYNNLYNRPLIFTQQETSNIFTTSNHINTNFYNKSQLDTEIKTKSILINKSSPSYVDSIFEVSDKLYVVDSLQTYNNLVYLKSGTNNFLSLNANVNTDIKANTSVNITAANNDINLLANQNIYLTSTNNKVVINPGLQTKTIYCANSSTDNAGYTDTIVDFSSNFYIRKNTLLDDLTTYGDRVYLGAKNSTLNLSQNGDASIYCANGVVSLWANNNYVVIKGTTIQLQGKVQIDTGSITRKAPRYFTTSRTANFDGISCLAYDIDLTQITSSENIDGINFRNFRMKFFFANGRLDYQRTPRSFDISISSYNTFSISCFESDGFFSGLDKATNSAYFLYKQNFNMITFCCPTSIFGTTNLKVCYILEDLLGK